MENRKRVNLEICWSPGRFRRRKEHRGTLGTSWLIRLALPSFSTQGAGLGSLFSLQYILSWVSCSEIYEWWGRGRSEKCTLVRRESFTSKDEESSRQEGVKNVVSVLLSFLVLKKKVKWMYMINQRKISEESCSVPDWTVEDWGNRGWIGEKMPSQSL